ncbi:uncharacterized protein PHALS_15408 [Plasmopara halstedii]|uniref:Uncharacterized protein n=1 Tax=Plasmopara halstedii TaxID=4781 RepID=A0A0P1AGH2_PLAHL|nr:uncharacterized protein PHALS_15408 [Plasmopara halstedii]CEG39869.1 hypothetical protein PHALS_15408 [Plasmopara halstedii]|eukprot:XP_024576238.1 hypothetical protein PHALS_15408 [Plasmopara halstedii]
MSFVDIDVSVDTIYNQLGDNIVVGSITASKHGSGQQTSLNLPILLTYTTRNAVERPNEVHCKDC